MVLQFSFQHVDQVNFSCKRTQTQQQNHFSTTPCPSHETLRGMFKEENVMFRVFFFFLTNHCTNYYTDSERFGIHNNIMIQTRETHKFA